MAFPVAAAIAGGSSILSGLLGAGAQGNAAQTNAAINMYNMNAQERDALRNLFYAMQIRGEQKQGFETPQGTTRFVPGRGWVTELSPEEEALLSASQGEQRQQLTTDAQRARSQRERSQDRATDADLQTQAMLQLFQDVLPGDENAIFERLQADDAVALNRGFDDAQNAALLQAFRQGTTPDAISSIVGAVGEDRGDAFAQARTGNRDQARALASPYNEQAQYGNLYNLFAASAGGAPSGTPAPYRDNSTANLGLALNRSAQGDSLLARAASTPSGRLDYTRPDFSMANRIAAFGQGGAALADAFRGLGNAGSGGGAAGFGVQGNTRTTGDPFMFGGQF